MEAVHNTYLDDEQIDSDQEAKLASLGFELAEDDLGPINWRNGAMWKPAEWILSGQQSRPSTRFSTFFLAI